MHGISPDFFSQNLSPMADGTKNPTLHGLKQHNCIFSFSYRSEISVSRMVSPPKSYTAKISVWSRLSSFLKILGMNPLSATFALLAEFHAMCLRFQFPWWLLPLGCPQLPEDLSITHLPSPSSVFKTTVAASTPFNYPHSPSTLLSTFCGIPLVVFSPLFAFKGHGTSFQDGLLIFRSAG